MARYHFPAPKTAAPGGTAMKPAADPCISVLETSYPRILENITMMWGFGELNNFFHKLILDDRGGRQGFPPEAWDELNTLSALHLIICPDKRLF